MNIYNGWLNINKPRGATSNHAVQKIKHLLGKNNKIGHAGTLDPLAEGILPIAVGEATKTTQFMMDAEKEYEFNVTWGEERSTFDAEGEITATGGHIPDIISIEKILPDFIGDIMQTPPIYSALKINGQPAYKLARAGKEIEMKQREIKIKKLQLIFHDEELGLTGFKVLCGKGTYVRSLAVDIARKLNTYGYVSLLKRTKVGNFFIKDAIMLANLDKIVHNILPVTHGLGDILVIEVTKEQATAIKHGLKIFLPSHAEDSKIIAQILFDRVLQAIVCIEKGVCKSMRVFNL
jgi:tRNA pseudouridine55 synthase